MNKQIFPWLLCTGLVISVFFPSCVSDELPEPTLPESCMDSIPTYAGSIKSIIDNSCAYSGCHLDGSAPGVYTSYEGLVNVVESGRFKEKVVDLREDPNLGMPPDFAPQGRPKDLTQFEFELIQCWLENNYPEK
ncbi:MAG: hypothetical protein H6556_21385 [Lewinellaceae bacterium]|nr:hypothetical protein [Lewinellaceae bacterium]